MSAIIYPSRKMSRRYNDIPNDSVRNREIRDRVNGVVRPQKLTKLEQRLKRERDTPIR